jgi:hypothetical protein
MNGLRSYVQSQGKSMKADTLGSADQPLAYLERRVCFCSNFFIFSKLYGGGGGSRTPVRKALRHEAYMLSSIPLFSPAALRMSKKRSRLVRWFSPEPYGPKGSGQLTV